MPMKKGHSPEVVSANVRELVRSGYKPKQAVAMALSSKRKYAKMAEGGMVDMDDEDEMPRDLYELNADSQEPEDVSNPMEMEEHSAMADMLRKADMFAMGGMVEGEEDGEMGNKPSEDMASSAEEPMKSESLDKSILEMLEEKKRSRKFR